MKNPLRRWPTYRRVLVNLHDTRAFDGVLYATRGTWLELRDAHLLAEGVEPVAMDGAVLIERPQIAFIQVRD
jgi:hypothetical protein